MMLIEIDFNSDEALYVQLQNQIIMELGDCDESEEGESFHLSVSYRIR